MDGSPCDRGNSPVRILVYGIGNPGRQDDALGPLVAQETERRLETAATEGLTPAAASEAASAAAATPGDAARPVPPATCITFDANYQLMPEDALAVAEHDVVVFVDASMEEIENIRLTRLVPDFGIAFSTHAVSAENILGLACELYSARPEAYMLHVRGCSWEVNEELTDGARRNLAAACDFLARCVLEPALLHESTTDGS